MAFISNTFIFFLATSLSATMAIAEPLRVYIPEGSADAVRVVDGNTGALIARVSGTEAVHGLAGSQSGRYLVAGSYTETDRTEIATTRPEAVTGDEHASHHAKPSRNIGPEGAGISLLSIIEVDSGEILRKVEVPGAVHHTAVSPDGRYAIATHPSEDGISVVDLETFDLIAWVPTGSMPNYVVFGSDPALAYVSNAGNGTVSEVDIVRGIVRRNFVLGEAPEHLAITADGQRLYAADADAGRILELSVSDGVETRSFNIGGGIHGLDLSEDGAKLFVAAKETDRLVAIDLISGDMRFAQLAPAPYHLTTVQGSGNIFVSSREEPKVWIVDAASLLPKGEIAIEGEGHQMVALR